MVPRYGGGMHGLELQEEKCDELTREEEHRDTSEEEDEGGEEEREEEEEEGREVVAPPASRVFGPRIMLALKVTCALLTIVVVVQSRGPLIQSTPAAVPFLPRYSLVSDFYTGDIVGLTERLLTADLSFVVYYAPWDRDSQLLRWELEKVARYHHEQIYFAAINCWHPSSECRARYKIRTFPAIVLHVRSASGQETKALAYSGPHEAGHMIRFLSRAIRPLTHVVTHADLARLQMEYSVVVLGYYDFSSSLVPKGFVTYYLASLRGLQHDTTASIAWGVVTNPRTARALSFNTTRSVHIVLWNTTLVYTNAASADSEAVSAWVEKRVDQTSAWVDVPGSKSASLSQVLDRGPALLLFAPDNPYHRANDPYMTLREVSLNYKNCDQSSRVTNLANYLGSVRSMARRQLRQAERTCKTYLQDQMRILHMSRNQLNLEDETCCHSVLGEGQRAGEAGRRDKLCDVCVHPDNRQDPPGCTSPTAREEESSLFKHVNKLMSVFSDSCKELVLQYSPWEHYSVCCQRNSTPPKAKVPHKVAAEGGRDVGVGQVDDRVGRLVSLAAEDQCKRLFHGSMLAPQPLLKDQPHALDVTGLGCKTNKTLSFIAVDSLRHAGLAERLGLNLSAQDPPNTGAAIVDAGMEAHFIMDAAVTKASLVQFVVNYTAGQLDRETVSGGPKPRSCEEGQVCIRELTSTDYLPVTQEHGQMVVVLHYSGSCATCTTVGHVFMTVARAAAHLPNVTFARINALHNTLPWHLHFHALPTLIVHPHYRKGESRVFDTSRQLTPGSVMSFLVANLSPSHRLALAVSTCRDQCRDLVLRNLRTTTTRLHHTLTTTTTRLVALLDKLAASSEAGGDNHTARHELLLHNKKTLVKDIKKQRLKLSYLGEVQNLFSQSLEGRTLDNPDTLLKTLSSLMAPRGSQDK